MNRSYPYLILGFVAWFLGASPTPAVGDVQYTITDLGPWRAYAINDAGQVVGEGPRIWDQGITSTIGSSSGTAYDINNRGVVVGRSGTQAFRWYLGSLEYLGTLGGPVSTAFAVNENGQVVGSSYVSSSVYRAFLHENGVMQDLGTLGGPGSGALGINFGGQVVGAADTSTPPPPGYPPIARAYLYDSGAMIPISDDDSLAFDITDSGLIVGRTGAGRGFLWVDGETTDLGASTQPYGLNERAQIVGRRFRNGYPTAMLWENGVRYDLDMLIPGDSGWVELEEAQDINERGQIVGSGRVAGDSRPHAFLLTPIPEPTSAALLLLCVLALPSCAGHARGQKG